MANHDTCINNF